LGRVSKSDKLQIITIAELLEGKKPNVPKFLPGLPKGGADRR